MSYDERDSDKPSDRSDDWWSADEYPRSDFRPEPGASSEPPPSSSAASPGTASPAPAGPEPDVRPSPRRVFIASPQLRPRQTTLLRLARWYHLDVWDGSLLGQRAGEQLEVASVLLTVVFVFELAMWGLLFNTIAYTSPWTVGWMTPVAFGFGGLFAVAVFVYEKSLVTADFAPSRRRLLQPGWGAFLLRVCLIGMSAIATAQPFELTFFNGQIEQRLKEETVRSEALRQAKVQLADRAEAQAPDIVAIEDGIGAQEVGRTARAAAETLELRETEKFDADARVSAAASAVARAIDRRNARVNELAAAKRADPPNQEQIERAVDNVERADRAIATANANLEAARVRQGSANRAASDASVANEKAADAKKQAREDAIRDAEAEAAEYKSRSELRKAWLDQVQAAPYGAQLVNPITRIPLAWNTADFVERLGILDDVRHGRTPRWPLSSRDDQFEAIQMFQLPNDLTGLADPRAEAWLDLTWQVYLVAYIIAFMIPLLTLGFKFWLMSPELRAYYSSFAQARAGCAEAIALRRARGLDSDDDDPRR